MRWIALQWRPEPAVPSLVSPGDTMPPELPSTEALGWWALQFTPRVAWVDEGLLLEVSTCERLWGGPRALLAALLARNPAPQACLLRAHGATSLVALARLRLIAAGQRPPADLPGGLPLHTLGAARPHLDMLERLGCRTWGELARLPRAGLSRRFGDALQSALDAAWGRTSDGYRWLLLPEHFDQKVELPALAENASELLWSAGRLLRSLQIWLRGRQRGVLALELQWTLDLKRWDGVDLPPHEQLVLRTAEPVQDTGHLQRLLGERLAQQKMAAPASWLRLRSLETAPLAGTSTSFLPEDNRKGDALHELVERLSARLGESQVLAVLPLADHRPEAMQRWLPARGQLAALAAPHKPQGARAPASLQADALYPGWLLPEPQRLDMRGGQPCWHGLLQVLAGPQRMETGWWTAPDGQPAVPTVRDYYIARSPEAGLVWIYRERHGAQEAVSSAVAGGWFLHGLYA